jgi:uncharacterized membrane protein
MKTNNIIYWVSTALFSAFMLFSGVGNFMVTPESVAFLSDHLGYPQYIIRFLGAAKILGSVALLIPAFPRIKEWAYAGLFFDLIGANYSMISVDGFEPGMAVMVVVLGVEAVSYFYFHKRLQAAGTPILA